MNCKTCNFFALLTAYSQSKLTTPLTLPSIRICPLPPPPLLPAFKPLPPTFIPTPTSMFTKGYTQSHPNIQFTPVLLILRLLTIERGREMEVTM